MTEKSNQQEQADIEMIEQMSYSLFDKWLNDLVASGDEGREEARRFAQAHGFPEKAPVVMMFLAFIGGMETGLDLAKAF